MYDAILLLWQSARDTCIQTVLDVTMQHPQTRLRRDYQTIRQDLNLVCTTQRINVAAILLLIDSLCTKFAVSATLNPSQTRLLMLKLSPPPTYSPNFHSPNSFHKSALPSFIAHRQKSRGFELATCQKNLSVTSIRLGKDVTMQRQGRVLPLPSHKSDPWWRPVPHRIWCQEMSNNEDLKCSKGTKQPEHQDNQPSRAWQPAWQRKCIHFSLLKKPKNKSGKEKGM
jgi:hypothetical protein